MTTHIVLMGPMGAGKSTAGAALARALDRPFDESDAWIEDRFGRSAARIAAEDGVEALHRIEADHALAALGRAEPAVIAIAASTIDDETATAAARTGFTVLLLAPIDVLVHRAASGRRDLGDDPAGVMATLVEARIDRWRAIADLVVDTTSPPERVVETILAGIDR